ncbi:reverse transcriptase domain-containing protein [Tanacetum coccineum]
MLGLRSSELRHYRLHWASPTGLQQICDIHLIRAPTAGGSSKQQNKRRKVIRAPTAGPRNKKEYDGTLPLIPTTATTQRPLVANQKTKVTHYECGNPGHYKSDCPKLKNQDRVNQIWKGKARGKSSVVADNVNA